MKVLIVEDNQIPANYLKKILSHEGYTVLGIVDKGMEAIQATRREKPDIILMDIMLKDHISGCDVALAVSKENPQVLIIFLTAYSDKDMIKFATESKAFGYLLKPYREQEILATLELAKSKLKDLQVQSEVRIKDDTRLALVNGYNYNTITQTLFHGKNEVPCGPKSLQLISLLCRHKDGTVKIEAILDELWKTEKSQQTLRSLIHRIRENTSENLIINVNKLGYKIGLAKN